jgi:hypothetical protein
MSQQYGGYPPSTTTGSTGSTGVSTDPPTSQVARDEATDVGRTAADAGRQVAGTAAEQARGVAQEVKTQARDLVGEARGQVQDQARTGQQKAAEGVRALSRELHEMAQGGQQSGPVSEIARQAAQRADLFADWIGEREPADLLEEVRSFARRRPGAFLAGMALAGVVVGRLTRGAVDSARQDSGPVAHRAVGPGYARPSTTPAPYVGSASPSPYPTGYDAPTPPQGYAAPPSYTPSPSPYPPAAPLPPAPGGAVGGNDPFAAPVDPAGRHSSGTTGDYAGEYDDELGTRSRPADREFDGLDDPYRPGTGELR